MEEPEENLSNESWIRSTSSPRHIFSLFLFFLLKRKERKRKMARERWARRASNKLLKEWSPKAGRRGGPTFISFEVGHTLPAFGPFFYIYYPSLGHLGPGTHFSLYSMGNGSGQVSKGMGKKV